MQGHVHKSLAKVALVRRRAPHGGDKPHAARYSHAQQETRHCQRHLRRLLRTPRPHVTEQPPHSATFHSKQESGTVIAHGLLVGGRSIGQREVSARLSSASRQLIDLADVPASEQADGAVHADQLEVGTQPIPLQSRSTHGSDVGGTSTVLLHSIDGVVGRPGMYGDTHINCTANELRSKSPSRSKHSCGDHPNKPCTRLRFDSAGVSGGVSLTVRVFVPSPQETEQAPHSDAT